jgi:hypothetical protein
VVELFEFLGFMGSWLQVFSEVFGDYFVNTNLGFKKKHTFFGSTSFSGGAGRQYEAIVRMTVDIQSGTACYSPY